MLPYETDIPVFTGKVDEPSTRMISIPVVLLTISADGTLVVEIDSRMMILAPDESWSRVVEADVYTDIYNGHLRVTSSVTNYGWLDIATIKFNQSRDVKPSLKV